MATVQDMKSFLLFFWKWGGNMRKSFLLAHSNLRKIKGQMTAITVLILLAAFMLNLWLMLSMDYKQNFDRCHDKLNAEHVTLAVDGEQSEMRKFLTQTLKNDGQISEFVLTDSMHMVGSFPYHSGEINTEFLFLDKETAITRQVGKAEIMEEGELQSGVYLPVLYQSDDIAVGKKLHVTIGSNEMTYTICGFFNSVMTGSHNCALCEMILTEDKYRELEEAGYAPKSVLVSIRLKDKEESEDYEAALKNMISSEYPAARMVSNSYVLVTTSRYISQMICAGVMSAVAFLILLIALVVISSNIINYIQENMKTLGALKAIGYTSRQVIWSLLLQFGGITLLFAMAGALGSYILFPFINAMMISQTGIPYAIHFLTLPFLLTLLILCGTASFVVWLSARRIKKIEPITALRQGVQTHNFKRNHVPLEETRASLTLALALKTAFSGIKHNITICITMLTLSLVVAFSGLMIKNVIADMTPITNLIIGEIADSCINVNVETENDFLRKVKEDKCVQKVYLYHSAYVSHVNGVELIANISDDFSKANNQKVVFKGRFPRYDNEIAVAAKYAKENDLKIGDEIAISTDGKEAKYIISGFTQISNNLGKDCLLTRSGYERMGELQNASYYLNLSDGTDIDAFNQEMEEQFGSEINTTINIEKVVSGTGSVYISLMTIIVIGIFILSGVVIAFVLYLLVRTMLSNKKREYGILKALGFTTGQLILQTSLAFMPPVILSTIVGIIVCSFIINPLTALFLSGIGIVECTFAVPVGFNIAAGIGLVVITFAIACLMSLKVKKIVPRELLSGE